MKETDAKLNIQWYPGHMTKTRRQIEADLKLVDAVCEIVDARIPMSSRNPDIDAICGGKPRILVLNRMDLADPEATKTWAAFFRDKGMSVIATDCKSRRGISDFTPAARRACAEKAGTGRQARHEPAPAGDGGGHSQCGKNPPLSTRFPAGRVPRRRTVPALPGASSGSPWMRGFSFWTLQVFSGRNLRIPEWA